MHGFIRYIIAPFRFARPGPVVSSVRIQPKAPGAVHVDSNHYRGFEITAGCGAAVAEFLAAGSCPAREDQVPEILAALVSIYISQISCRHRRHSLFCRRRCDVPSRYLLPQVVQIT